ncbi:hypothetical protein FRC07_007306 [Ceratobasidium sp. 392]|nr:hypothetical protein FRC07_007306 [Ceratobasidium sp. 392]
MWNSTRVNYPHGATFREANHLFVPTGFDSQRSCSTFPSRELGFSALYPPTPITLVSRQGIAGFQSVTWNVDTKPDDTLLDHRTNREVWYLFWEARTKPPVLLSPTCSRSGSPVQDVPEAFDPARPTITHANSVSLPFDKVTAYIDDTLMAFGLHTEARCSFITYWLPDIQVHKHIALRFLPQVEYEAAAPMSITPAPAVTTRVFMLFQGLQESELELWADAAVRANEDPSMWRAVVGVNFEKSRDAKLFRVLKWGGMELR